MGKRHDHDVAGGVGESVEADEAVLSAKNEAPCLFGLRGTLSVGDSEVDGGDEVAEDAAKITGPGAKACGDAGAHRSVRRRDVGKAPGSPEVIHYWGHRPKQYRRVGRKPLSA